MLANGWWSYGLVPEHYSLPLTQQSARLTMTNNRVFGRAADVGDVWDLRDSVLELCENEHRLETLLRSKCGVLDTIDFRSSFDEERILQWLADDPGNGFIRIYPPDTNEFSRSCLVPCNLKTSVYQICQKLGIGVNVIHLQMNGHAIRRLEPQELPLSIQNDFLVSLGYADIFRIQEEGSKEDLAYLIKFYSGKPICEGGVLSNPVQGYVQAKKGGMFQQWTTRWCAIYNTRLHFYKDDKKKDSPTIFQLTGGVVERTEVKNSDFCLKITTRDSDKQIFLSFSDEEESMAWFRKCKKATDRLPTTADLSCCHLEYLPENVFINKDLVVLNLQHNLLKDRMSADDTMLGWIDDLERFSHLRSLNLADNSLHVFPLSICRMTSLVELNLASNKIKEVPPNIKLLENLQALHLHNNHLTNLPDEVISLKKLSILILAFNRFTNIPTVAAQMTNIRFSDVDSVVMAGNQIERIATDVLMELKHARKLDLRLNMLTLPLTETMKFSVLEHLSHLDVRDNQISELDLRSVKTLEVLYCERNGMSSLALHGGSLKVLQASYNCLDQLVIFPKPEGLVHLDLSDNCLEYFPDWLSDCYQLKKLVANENFLRELPPRLFTNAKKLTHINLAHNHLTSLPIEVGELLLEELQIQRNYIFSLPQHLLKRLTRLTLFNSSQSLLQSLPPLNENSDLNRLQVLHLSGNFLGNDAMKVITGYRRLKILNLAHNEISELYDEDIMKLEMLQELNISSNQLQCLPESLGMMPNLVVLRAHSNYLASLPNFCNAKSLRILDVGHNKLLNISVTDLMASKLNLLDIGLNERLNVDRHEFRNLIGKKNICLVDSSGQNRKLPGITRRRLNGNMEPEDPSSCPWKVGFSESSGSRNKLCIQIVKFLDFTDNKDCLVGILDGGRNSELPRLLAKSIKKIIQEEICNPLTREKFMKYSFLTAHRNLKLTGQKLGMSAALCHIHKTAAGNFASGGNRPHGRKFDFVLTIANVGDVEAVMCRKGEAVLLTRKFVALSDSEEMQRICKSSGIITEDGKVNGVTPCTRLLGCAHLHPQVIPEPFCISLALQSDDEFVIIANSSFWKYVPYEEAVEEAYNIGNPIVASKHLQDMAECYGSKENIAVLVLRLNTEPGPSLGRLKPPHREMSIDDVEAAIQHDLEIAQKRSNQKKLIGGHHLHSVSFIKNRQFLQQTRFPMSPPIKLFNNNNNNNNDGINLQRPQIFNNQRNGVDKSIPYVEWNDKSRTNNIPTAASLKGVVTFPFQATVISGSSDSSMSPCSTEVSSKTGNHSVGDCNSSSTNSHWSSVEGSISFTHNGQSSPSRTYGPDSKGPAGGINNHINSDTSPQQVHQSSPRGPDAFRAVAVPPSPLPRKSSVTVFESHRSDRVERSPRAHPPKHELNNREVRDDYTEASFTSSSVKKSSGEIEDFPLHLKIDGPGHNKRTTKLKPLNEDMRPQSRFVKRSSALDALATIRSPSRPMGDSYFCSSDSLFVEDDSLLDPANHLNKIASAKEKKISMHLTSTKGNCPMDESTVHGNFVVISPGKMAEPIISPNPAYSIYSSEDIKDSEIAEIMTSRPPVQPPTRKRNSIMNTIAMFESVNTGKPSLVPAKNRDLPDENATTTTSPVVENKMISFEVHQNAPDYSRGTLNPANYQIRTSVNPLERRRNTDPARPPTLVRSAYTTNVGLLPKSYFEFNKETNNIANKQTRTVNTLEIAKF